MQLNVSSIPKSNKILIPVASQNLGSDFVTDVKEIICGDRRFKTFNWFEYAKGEVAPGGLFLLALGFDLDFDQIWKSYPQSDKIYLIICSEIKEEANKKEEVERSNELPNMGFKE